jgi:hypothetical protein
LSVKHNFEKLIEKCSEDNNKTQLHLNRNCYMLASKNEEIVGSWALAHLYKS